MYDVLVVGGGIAGASIAYELATTGRAVCVLEGEPELARHTTGRSAATWIGGYGPPEVQRLTRASRTFLEAPPFDVTAPLLRPLPCLYVGGPDADVAAADAVVAATAGVLVDPADAERINPVLRPGWTQVAVIDETACDLDVAGLHQGYARALRGSGGVVRTSARVLGATREAGLWRLSTTDGSADAPVVVVAAGAWGDEVGRLMGSPGVGLEPRRRTMFGSPTAVPLAGMPFTCDLEGGWYLKAEGDLALCSPEDAEPHAPGDPKPDELEIARTIEAINEATVLGLRSVRTAWAGLRTFAADGEPVARYDEHVDGLFWFVGQAGYGIQMAPALAAEAAERLVVGPPPVFGGIL
ncbi:NAD(P)/FAD-dependent oxidoreductase [Nocardioides sp. CPCC 206347]|uniref:NAD(P)/FAD-dependent oxidoreductase n=1 Tax=unclassified Nocardioides TaxID=2615069 RepID=UPI003612F86A